MPKRKKENVACPMCHGSPWRRPNGCRLCEGARSVTEEMSTAYRLLYDSDDKSGFKNEDVARKVRQTYSGEKNNKETARLSRDLPKWYRLVKNKSIWDDF